MSECNLVIQTGSISILVFDHYEEIILTKECLVNVFYSILRKLSYSYIFFQRKYLCSKQILIRRIKMLVDMDTD